METVVSCAYQDGGPCDGPVVRKDRVGKNILKLLSVSIFKVVFRTGGVLFFNNDFVCFHNMCGVCASNRVVLCYNDKDLKNAFSLVFN